MSKGWVIDSSVGFGWIHADQATPETDRLLAELESGGVMVVPAFWFLEIANTVLSLQRRRKMTREERKYALATLSRMNLTIDVESGNAAFHKISELAEEYGLSIYDAVYLEVALRRGLALASRDRALVSAAKKCGVQVL